MSGAAKVEVGQAWRDEDGLKWKVHALTPGFAHIKRFGYRTSMGIQIKLAWFDRWTLVKPAPPTQPEGQG